jgi:hypothetical protein
MNNTPVQYGFLLAALTLAAFFAVIVVLLAVVTALALLP